VWQTPKNRMTDKRQTEKKSDRVKAGRNGKQNNEERYTNRTNE